MKHNSYHTLLRNDAFKTVAIVLLLLLLSPTTWAQNGKTEAYTGDAYIERTQEKKTPLILHGAGKVNVEKLKGKIDTQMDISKLNLVELRAIRNAFAARQGYAFKDATLRALYNTTTWYNDVLWNTSEKEETTGKKFSPRYTKEQLAFTERIRAREAELRKLNFKPANSKDVVNMDNLINPFQLKEFDSKLYNMLGKNGFAIVPAEHNQLFHVYEKNDYADFPSFVTTDLYLQLFHLYFDCVLRDVEEKHLDSLMIVFSSQMEAEMKTLTSSQDAEVKAAAEFGQAWFAVASWLFSHDKAPASAATLNVPEAYKKMVMEEITKAIDAENGYSDMLEYFPPEEMFGYSLFRPRGHYTRSKVCSRYFRGMMWLQTAHFGTNKPSKMKQIALIANVINQQPKLSAIYNKVSEPITYLMGTPDNVTILQVANRIKEMGLPIEKLLSSRKEMANLTKDIEEIAKRQMRIELKKTRGSKYVVDIMPQRYQPDAEALITTTDQDSPVSLRPCPKGLDWMAVMGLPGAERILIDELKETQRWAGFPKALTTARKKAATTQWEACVANQWMYTLQSLGDTAQSLPYFMQSPQWQKKNLDTALASWAELKHDAILYAKQPMLAECGDGGPEPPVVKGYVEPNVKFWEKAIALVTRMDKVLTTYGLQTEKAKAVYERIKEMAEFCRDISKKELNGGKITDEEYNQIEIIGSTVENISLELVSEDNEMLQGWSDVVSTDKKVAVVADVFTASGENVAIDNKCVLYEGVGPAYEIYVVVEIDGSLYLTRGAVLSYREFTRLLSDPRMTDEEWQEELKKSPTGGTPSWMKEIIAPVKGMSADDEETFYSSGC
ncbi:hypothetical protein AXF23_04275 [Prevotella sp. oral taxon 313]|uniref:DUF3160 domain-containing protein n=1 Tax=Prevotella sp. oral taxon 313 TaxID=652722 RepID=UPI000D1E9D3B|nr:DUF3160 domain-containing protein [Prevotella sp. oral taxon 313]PTL30379.1 hypothetical protein AXF23_04275 [Prevotella sp. oral taxon 313]